MRTSGCCFLSKSVRYVFESATICDSLMSPVAKTMKINMPSEDSHEFTWLGPRVNIISEFTRNQINLLHAIALFVSACYWQFFFVKTKREKGRVKMETISFGVSVQI